MSGRNDGPPLSAMDAAMALLSEEEPQAQAPDARETRPQAEEPQPDRSTRQRDNRGRFRGHTALQPDEPQGQPEQAPAPAQPQVDWEAEARRVAEENRRLKGTYANNVEQLRTQKDAEIERLRKEAQDARQAADTQRKQELQYYRDGVARMADGPEKWQAVNDLAALERGELERERQSLEEERRIDREAREQQTQQQQQTEAQRTELAQKAGLWATVEGYVYTKAREYGFDDADVQEIVEGLKTPEMAAAFQHLPMDRLLPTVMARGNRLSQEIQRRAEARLDRNRQEAVRQGAHQQDRPGQPQPGPRPVDRYVRGTPGVRPGLQNARNMAAALLEDE